MLQQHFQMAGARVQLLLIFVVVVAEKFQFNFIEFRHAFVEHVNPPIAVFLIVIVGNSFTAFFYFNRPFIDSAADQEAENHK